MYLKRVDLKGFKSFADKTELDFRSGITAVVGPNGSGKSNISDAIRWVLGEQSVKQLRGGKMEDVIFAGTQFRKPLGQAQVSLTLDNSCGTLGVPWNEVTVTRKLYRSGESEYLLNSNTVRLKDIHELFMDTGIGREGYSIIGQGKIDAILSGKADERRVLVEEAAGITKFRNRKEEGERKLKNAEENLERVGDIITTYEERIGPLKREKEKAEKFIILDGELKNLEISLAIHDLDSLEVKNKDLEEGRLANEKLYTLKEMELKKEEEKAEELNIKADELSEEVSKKKEEYFIIRGNIDEKRADIRIAEAKAENLKNSLKSSEKHVETALEDINKGSKDLEDYSVKMSDALEDKKNKEKELNRYLIEEEGLKKEADIKEEAIKEVKRQTGVLNSSLSGTEKEISDLKAAQEYIRGKAENLTSQREGYKASLKLNKDALIEVEEEKEKTLLNLKDIRVKAENLKNLSEELRKNLSLKREKTEELRREAANLKNRETILKNLEDSMEGYIRPVRDLMAYLERKKSPYLDNTEVLGEVISTKPRYAAAIEAALGGYVGNVITDTDTGAGDLIKILKKENLGRVTFLPRNVIKARNYKMPEIKGINVLGLASELTETSPQNRNIIDSVLGGTIVTETLEDALKAARQTGHRVKLVTLDGDIIAAGGAMTGGSRKGQKSGVISRRAEIEEISAHLKKITEEGKKSLEEEAQIQLKLEKTNEELRTVSSEESNVTLQFERLKERSFSFMREGERIEKLLNGDEGDEGLLSEDSKGITEKLSKMEEVLRSTEKKLNEKNRLLLSLESERDEKNRELKILLEKITELKILKNQATDREDRIRDETEKLSLKLHETKEKINSYREEAERYNKEIEETEKNILSVKGELKNLEEELIEADKKTDELYMEEVKVKSLIKASLPVLERLREEKTRAEKELYKFTLSLEKYEKEKGEIIKRLNEGLNLTVAEARDMAGKIESPQATGKRISYLKTQISSLGNINTASIEEYFSVSGNLTHLTSQRDDLLKAREELTVLIRDMTGKMRKLFRENFKVLSENFKDTFKQLFGGGNAELILGEGDELTGNIDIHVQPPGKKLQNISLLSGGEKVLSAIALTFGILRMKPSPFCILDEIEAALDDANVYRYADFLKEFKGETQFILITHRKGTMEAADIMYGVTMEEKGISKIVSLDLEKAEKMG